MRFHPKYAAIAGVAAASLAVAGCGGSASPLAAGQSGSSSTKHATPADAVQAAYQTTVKAKSARISLNETVKVLGHTEHVTGAGVIPLAGKKGDLSLSIPSLGSLREVIMLPHVYVQLPATLRQMIPGHKAWVGVNIDQLGKADLGATLGQLSSSAQTPTGVLAELGAVSSDGVTKVGPATVGGVATTHYRARVDLTKAVASKSAAVRAAVKKLQTQMGHADVPVDVWIDHQGRVRQMASTASVTENGQRVSSTTLLRFTAFDVAVNVSAPPASQTLNVTKKLLKTGL